MIKIITVYKESNLSVWCSGARRQNNKSLLMTEESENSDCTNGFLEKVTRKKHSLSLQKEYGCKNTNVKTASEQTTKDLEQHLLV